MRSQAGNSSGGRRPNSARKNATSRRDYNQNRRKPGNGTGRYEDGSPKPPRKKK